MTQALTVLQNSDDAGSSLLSPLSLQKRLAAWLSHESGQSWSVVVTTNQTRLASVQRQERMWTLRVVEPLLDPTAWPDVLAYLRGNDRAAALRLRDRVEERAPLLPLRWRPSPRRDVHHVLSEAVGEVVARYFSGAAPAPVTWAVGHASTRARSRHVELGCFVAHIGRVLLDPCLDRPDVPAFYLHFVIFHELLHAHFEAQGHRSHRLHDRVFRNAEAEFDGYARVRDWEERMLPHVLSTVTEPTLRRL